MGHCDLHPLGISLRVMGASALVLIGIGLPLAWALGHGRWRGRRLLEIVVSLPLVFPPVAIGFFLLLLLGRRGWLNALLPAALHIDLVFSFAALVLASTIAGLPLMVRPIEAALSGATREQTEAAMALGKSRWETLLHVTLPGISGALAAGLTLGLGRGLGEVGMSLMLGGNLIGRTDTLSLAIYNGVLEGDFACARHHSLVLAGVAVALFFVVQQLERRPQGG